MAQRLRLIVEGGGSPWLGKGAQLRLGRSSSNELQLDRPGVSRRHARILGIGQDFLLEDLGSTNGTFLNGRRIARRVRLAHGDRIGLGQVEIEVELVGGAGGAHARRRRRQLASGALLLVTLLALAHRLLGGAAQAEIAELEGPEVLEVAELEPDDRFGPGVGGPGAVVFGFHAAEEALPTRVSLRYDAAAIGEETVEVQLNGQAIGFSAAAPKGGAEDLEVILPDGLLRRGQGNRLAFITAYGATEAWEIANPRLVVEPIPACAPAACVEEAARLHALGLRKREAAALIPANLYEAWASFREAGLFLLALGERIPLQDHLEAQIAEAKEALDRRCNQLRFAVLRSVALGDEDAARQAAQEILQAFPGDGHRCRSIGRHLLELLDEP